MPHFLRTASLKEPCGVILLMQKSNQNHRGVCKHIWHNNIEVAGHVGVNLVYVGMIDALQSK